MAIVQQTLKNDDASRWCRLDSGASTVLPNDDESRWSRADSAMSASSAAAEEHAQGPNIERCVCPNEITADTEDWRPLTATLRHAFRCAQYKEEQNACVCPAEITADTEDWRPLTVSLRKALECAKIEEEQHSCVCPPEITAETEDWRPLTVSLRQALERAKQEEAAGIRAEPAENPAEKTADGFLFIAVIFLLCSVSFAGFCLPPIVAGILFSLCMSILAACMVFPGSVRAAAVALLVLPALHVGGSVLVALQITPPM